MPATLEAQDRALLEAPNFCLVATLREDGTPHVVPTWVDIDGEDVVLNTAEGRAWIRNLRRNRNATLTVLNHENPYEYLTVRGSLSGDTHDGADEHIDRMAKKYLGQDSYPFRQPGEERVIVRVTPEKVHHHGA
ncbi:MAG: PPOX class F420-dependent oxidoreductase [Solirubrobacteraceae bacterium]